MALTVGLDVQPSRTCIAFMDKPLPADIAVLGDGSRSLVPNAVTADAWGSAAATSTDAGQGTALRPWTVDGTSPDFLRGVLDRVRAHCGIAAAQPAVQWMVSVSPDQAAGAVPRSVSALGGVASAVVDPTEALLNRWWRQSGAEPPPAVVVAIGERSTTVRGYRFDGAPGSVRPHASAGVVLASGSGACSDRLAREILQRCRERPDPGRLLALDDGVHEFADRLRAVAPTDDVRWWGPLREEMFEPFEITRTAMSDWPEVSELVAEIVDAVAGERRALPGAELTVVGGAGAAWPFGAASCEVFGPVWTGAWPAFDVARGAVESARRSRAVVTSVATGHPSIAVQAGRAQARREPARRAPGEPLSSWPDE